LSLPRAGPVGSVPAASTTLNSTSLLIRASIRVERGSFASGAAPVPTRPSSARPRDGMQAPKSFPDGE
jgi:hypothetical protein